MAYSFDKNGKLKPYKQTVSSVIVKLLSLLTFVGGLVTLFIMITDKHPEYFIYGISAILGSSLLYVIGNIADDIHHMDYQIFRNAIDAHKRDQQEDAVTNLRR